jgi:hypothetical protein
MAALSKSALERIAMCIKRVLSILIALILVLLVPVTTARAADLVSVSLPDFSVTLNGQTTLQRRKPQMKPDPARSILPLFGGWTFFCKVTKMYRSCTLILTLPCYDRISKRNSYYAARRICIWKAF